MTFFRGSMSLGPAELVTANQSWRPYFLHAAIKALNCWRTGMIVVRIEHRTDSWLYFCTEKGFDPTTLGRYLTPETAGI